jgi:leader peptidase (prepilin peptidase)/N-methyltransferase
MTDALASLHGYFTLLAFFGGACVGSFLNVCIYRIPLELSLSKPSRSFCPACGKTIAWYDNLPLISYFALRGRCRQCSASISVRYVLVEALTAVLFLLVWLKYGWSPLTPIYMLVVSGLILATFVDLEHLIIPDRVSLGGMPAGLLLSALFPALHGMNAPLPGLYMSLIGLSAGFGTLWLVAVLGKLAFKKDAMGFGDVKLLGAMGAFMGWHGVLFVIMISSLAGSVIGLLFIFSGKKEWQSRIPYGPYLALAGVCWVLWGTEWWGYYVQWVSGDGS